MIDNMEILKDLCLEFGPSGCEDNVRSRIIELGKKLCGDIPEIKTDKMGNVIFCFKPTIEVSDSKKVMLSAHMDEVGFMINEITDDGYLKFDTLGGIDERVLCGRCVTVGDGQKMVSGVIASKAIHHQSAEEREKTTPVEDMYIDIGAVSKEDAEKYVEIGYFGTFDSDFVVYGSDKSRYVKSKALDDRMGCAVLLLTMEKLARGVIKSGNTLYFCFTVREELGLSGSQVVAQRLMPDYSIVFETTAIADIVGVADSARVADTGHGGVISLMDRSTVYNIDFVRWVLELGEKNSVPVQVKRYVSGGNDAGNIHKSGLGVKTLALSVPTRYLHSPSCVAALSDYKATEDLAALIISEWISV